MYRYCCCSLSFLLLCSSVVNQAANKEFVNKSRCVVNCRTFYERLKEVRDYHRRLPSTEVTEVRTSSKPANCLNLVTKVAHPQHPDVSTTSNS